MEREGKKCSQLLHQLRKSCIITLIDVKVATVCTIKRADCTKMQKKKFVALKSTLTNQSQNQTDRKLPQKSLITWHRPKIQTL